MRNISDNELDKLFQDAAQHIEPEFDPGDWDKLSKRIDHSERINLFKRIGIYLSLALLIIFSTWLGIHYFQGQPGITNDSTGRSEAGIENKVSGNTIADGNESRTDINTSAEHTGIESGDNGTSTGSEQAESSAFKSGNEASLSSGSEAAQKSQAIAAEQDRAAITSTTADQSVPQSALTNRNTKNKSDIAAQSAAASRANPNGNSINKSAEDADVLSNQQRIQKQKRTVAAERKKREEGSLSASGNSDANGVVTSDKQKSSAKNEKASTQTAVNVRSDEEIKKSSRQNDEATASYSQRSSSFVTSKTTSVEKQKSVGAGSDTLTAGNARAGVKENEAMQSNKTLSANDQPIHSTREVKTDAHTTANTLSDEKGVADKSIGTEKTGVVSNNPSDHNRASEEDSLQYSTQTVKDVYNDNRGISGSDTIASKNNRYREGVNATGKSGAGGIENTIGSRVNEEADRVISGSDNSLKKTEESKSNSASEKDTDTTLPISRDEVVSSENGGIVKQTTLPTSGIPVDSLSDQQESSTANARRKTIFANDSSLTKPVEKKDSLDHAVNHNAAEEDKREVDEKTNTSTWYVKLLVSPDFSAIGYNRPGKTGVNIGLMVEYSPLKHWGFSAGAIWSKKLYDKNNPGKSYSYGGISFEADYLDGDCRVLDIPINITYYISPEARLNFYATMGVSSYIMLKEDYVYTVTDNNNNYYYYEDYKNKNRHWFSMLNLSFGLQYRISPRLQFQVEPFLKAPMSGVGQGKIDLVSAGSFFTLKYRIK